jgi:hypothetical protein
LARPVREELRYADNEARRYVYAMLKEAKVLSYPTMAAFAKDIARGTVSLAPTPEDPQLEWVGRFIWSRKEIERKVILSAYDSEYTVYVRAHRLGMSPRRYDRVKECVLLGLSGYLRGKEEVV